MIWTIAGILAVLTLLQACIEPFLIRSTYASYPLSEEQVASLARQKTLSPITVPKNLSAPEKGRLRILFFSDLHANHFFLPRKYLIKRLLEHRPDLIVFGGDLVSREKDAPKGLGILKELAIAAAKKSVPVLLVRGNHDVTLSDESLRQCGVTVLRNSATRLHFKKRYLAKPIDAGPEAALPESSRKFIILGLDDRRVGQVDITNAKQTDALPHAEALNITFAHARFRFEKLDGESTEQELTRLLFAHNPDTILQLSRSDCDYFFAGHFHGGQIRLPFRLEFKSLRGEQLSQERYYSGHFVKNEITAFISRGIGCVLFPLRYFCRPEITVFDI